MQILTAKAIDTLFSLFTDEEQEALSITRNNIKVTLLDQFISRWGACKPRYELNVFKVKAILILDANQDLIFRIKEFSKPEIREKLNQLLIDPQNFIKKKEVVINNDGNNKKINVGQNDSFSVLRVASKTRSGNAESGQEFIELDKLWDKEDMQFLNDGLKKAKINPTIQIEGQQPDLIDNIKVNMAVEGETNTEFLTPIAKEKEVNPIELTEEEPTLHSISSAQSRQKNMNQSLSSMFNFSQDKLHNDSNSTHKDFSLANAYNKIFSFKLRNLRELLFQILDPLFFPPCR